MFTTIALAEGVVRGNECALLRDAIVEVEKAVSVDKNWFEALKLKENLYLLKEKMCREQYT